MLLNIVPFDRKPHCLSFSQLQSGGSRVIHDVTRDYKTSPHRWQH